ncbi:MAG: NUDIX domain-containing protein, partial [Rectinema sp.]|nr:NUDIX domain-containing protein [Rectinema sp.]
IADRMPRSVAGIAIHNSLVFVARRKKDATPMSLRWEFPGGKVEKDEADEEALHREFEEELGAHIQIMRFLGETLFHHNGQARVLAAWQISFDAHEAWALNEHEEIAWLPYEVLVSLPLADSDRSLLPLIAKALEESTAGRNT